MSAFQEVMKSAIIFHVNLKGRIASWEAKCSMFSTRNKNDLNIFFPLRSDRVNGGQAMAITHGKELSSCTLAGGARARVGWQRGHSQPDSQKTERDQTERKELSLQSGAAAAAGLPAASRKEEQNCRARKEKSAIGKTTLSLPLSSAARSSRSPRS